MNRNRKVLRTVAAAGLVIAMTTGIALASIGTGTVTASSLRLRSEPSTTSATLTIASKNAVVSLLGKAADGWYQVSYGDTTGYMSAEWLTVALADNSSAAEAGPIEATVTDGPLNVRSGPDTSYDRIGTLNKGAAVTILDHSVSGWYEITDGSVTGYVSAQYISTEPVQVAGIVTAGPLNVRSGPDTSYDRVASLKQGASVTILDDSVSGWYKISCDSVTGYVSSSYVAILGSGSSSVGASAAALAASLVGCRYVYGSSGPNSFDCSGLTYYIYKQLGYTIARGSSSQYNQSGYFVSLDNLMPGDLIYFFDPHFDSSGGTLPTTHTGIYVGNNQFIHASTTTYRVQYDTLFGSYYGNYVVAAKRIA